MGVRLNKVLTELNIGLQTAVDFLKKKSSLGEVKDDVTPNTKITDEQYQALVSEADADEDIYLDEFSDEIDQWIIDSIKAIGLDTAKAVLNAPREMLIEKADLEEETVDEVLNILRAEFE